MSIREIDISVRVNEYQAVTRDRLHDCPMAKCFKDGDRYIAWCASNTANRPEWVNHEHCAVKKVCTGGGVLGFHYAITVSDAVISQLQDLLMDNGIAFNVRWSSGVWS